MLTKLPLGGRSTSHRRSSLNSSRRSSRSSADENGSPASPAEGGEEDTIVEPEQGNVLSHIISQLRPGADLSRVTLPTFILEPRSMLERITNFMAHPDTLLPMPEVDDPLQRFVSVVKFYLSGWHIKPPGVKKPLNPILGETYTCYWNYEDGTRGYYISEQTSHHPPKSSYFFMAPEHRIRIDGTLKPRSKFLGNSAASMMEGIAILRLLNRGNESHGERYILTQPNMYARGILFGKMKYELGDHSYVRCPENNLVADLDFKTKGYFYGTYNAIGGTIRNESTGEVYYELSGLWNGEMYIKDVATGQKELLFDASHAKHSPPLSRPLKEQGERESQRLWHDTVQALLAKDHEGATNEKSRIEGRQREEAAERTDKGVEWSPRFFRHVQGGHGGSEEGEEDLDWILDANINSENSEAATQQILSIAPIVEGQEMPHNFDMPSRESFQASREHSETSSEHPTTETSEQSNAIDSRASSPRPPEDSKPDATNQDTDASTKEGQNENVNKESLDQGHSVNLLTPLQQTDGEPHSLKRKDSLASANVDEFHDARG